VTTGRKYLGGTPRYMADAVDWPQVHEVTLFMRALQTTCPHVLGSVPRDEFYRLAETSGTADHGPLLAALDPWAACWNLGGTWVVGFVVGALIEKLHPDPLIKDADRMEWIPGTLDAFGKDPIDRGPPWRLTMELGGWNQAYKWDDYKDHVLALVRKELERYRLEQRKKAREAGVRYLDAPVKYQADHYEWLALRVCGRQRLRHGTHRVGLSLKEIASRYELNQTRHAGRVTQELSDRLKIPIPEGRKAPRRPK
jgi:hypothetical protein